tara:strand:- start:2617 stop:3192 length:576 start_codon:yes stop_codon:yes gene_type:complete
MINSLLYRKGDSSLFLFNGFCDNILSSRDELDTADCFFVDNMSFNIRLDNYFYLFSFLFNHKMSKNPNRFLLSNCVFLNEMLNVKCFCFYDSNIIVRKDWLSKFSPSTLFGKFNKKKDYSFLGNLVKISEECECYVDKNCNIHDRLAHLSTLLKKGYRVRSIAKSRVVRSFIIRVNEIEVPDPSLFVIEKI